jgi:hypothetical protein
MNPKNSQSKHPQKPDDDIVLLLHTLDKMGVETRRGVFDSSGGLTRIGDQYVLFLNDTISPGQEKELCLDAIRRMGTSSGHIPPRVRELLGENDWDNIQGATNG